MLKIVIIDDEKHVRILIKKLLILVGIEHIIVGESAFAEEGKNIIQNTNPDIVLLDIKLKDGTGFDLLDKLEMINFQLIFITAFNDYAIKAFKFNALDYILKPINPDELKNAILKSVKQLKDTETLKLLLKNQKENEQQKDNKIVIKTTQQTYIIPINNIYYIQSDRSYSTIFLKGNSIFTSKNLKFFYDILPKDIFIKTHKSYVVNKSFIKNRIQNYLVLKNEVKIPISVRKITEIKKQLDI